MLLSIDDATKDSYVLESLDFNKAYSELEFEQALIWRLEGFLFELGDGFSFVGRKYWLCTD